MIDWNHIESTVLEKFEEGLRQTKQSPKWHEEGDVYIHTMMVFNELQSLPEYQELDEKHKHILNIAALLHDVGKITNTVFENGDWHTPHHASKGSRMARELLWKDYGLCGQKELMETRETICQLIDYHSFPQNAIRKEGSTLKLHKIASNGLLVPDFSIKMLCILAKADMKGRICYEIDDALERIAYCEELAKEEGCYESCFPFPTLQTQRAFLSGRNVWKSQDLFDETWGEIIMMSGLPGTGKDTWIQKNIPDLPMVSLDEIRRENKIAPTENQGTVANIAKEQAKAYLRKHQPFVWNATNITTPMRESLINLFESYNAHVSIVYLETDWKTQLERNDSREDAVPQRVIENMFDKLVLPERFEARKVEWICV